MGPELHFRLVKEIVVYNDKTGFHERGEERKIHPLSNQLCFYEEYDAKGLRDTQFRVPDYLLARKIPVTVIKSCFPYNCIDMFNKLPLPIRNSLGKWNFKMNLENYLYSLCQHRATVSVENCSYCTKLEVDGTLHKISKRLDALLDPDRIDEMEAYIRHIEFEGKDLFHDKIMRKTHRQFKFRSNSLYVRDDFFSKVDSFAENAMLDNGDIRIRNSTGPVLGEHLPPGLRSLDTYREFKLKQFTTAN